MHKSRACISVLWADVFDTSSLVEDLLSTGEQPLLFGAFLASAGQALWLNSFASECMYKADFDAVCVMLSRVASGLVNLADADQFEDFKNAFRAATRYLQACGEESESALEWYFDNVVKPELESLRNEV